MCVPAGVSMCFHQIRYEQSHQAEVSYGKYSGTEIEHDGVKYLMMRQNDVLAVLG